jgi:hypothetical protein
LTWQAHDSQQPQSTCTPERGATPTRPA